MFSPDCLQTTFSLHAFLQSHQLSLVTWLLFSLQSFSVFNLIFLLVLMQWRCLVGKLVGHLNLQHPFSFPKPTVIKVRTLSTVATCVMCVICTYFCRLQQSFETTVVKYRHLWQHWTLSEVWRRYIFQILDLIVVDCTNLLCLSVISSLPASSFSSSSSNNNCLWLHHHNKETYIEVQRSLKKWDYKHSDTKKFL